MKNKSIKLNALLNIIKTCMSIIFPLITFPYVSRILGVENLGKINYGLSIISYFSLIAALGINVYAIREGSKIKNNKAKINQFINEVFALNIITMSISYVGLFALLFFTKQLKSYSILILIQSLSIVFTTFGVDWINTIYEDYLAITIRTLLSYFLSLILLFVFVKTNSDYYIYCILTVVTNAFICVFNNIYCRKYVKIRPRISLNLIRHLRSSIVFFANNIAIQIYVNIDITMLGIFTTDFCVGIYSTAVKIYSIIKSLLAAIYTVTISRLSFYIGQKDYVSFKYTITELVSYLTLILIPCIAGLIMVSDDIIIILSGENYINAGLTLRILSIGLFFAIYGGLINNCINIPLGNEKINVKATTISALVNLLLNFIFIPLFKENGAAFTTVLSEFIVCFYCIFKYKDWNRIIELKHVKKTFIHSICGTLGVMVTIFITSLVSRFSLFIFVIKVFSSCLIYSLILILFKNKELLSILNKLKCFIYKSKKGVN